MIRYTPHARQRMARRRIVEADLELVIAEPQITYPSGDAPDREVRVRVVGTRRLAAVVEIHPGQDLVITAYEQTDDN